MIVLRTSALRYVHILVQKLDLDQMPVAQTHTERHRCNKTHYLLNKIVWVIVMISVMQNGV